MPLDALPGPIVTEEWVRRHRDGLVVVDVRWYLDGRSGRSAYGSGHIAGAVFCDLDRDLAGPPSPAAGRHPLPDPEHFAAAMSALGVGGDDSVVAYDDAGGTVAARLVWMLRALDHPAALLDGGLASWPEPLEATPHVRPPARYPVTPWPCALLASSEEVAERGSGELLIDARAPGRYRGEVEPVDPRAGHIPGAVNLPTVAHVDPTSQRFLAAAELRRNFESAGLRAGGDVVAYCGSGVNACHTLLALEAAGLGRGRLYAGSWSQWSADESKPAATGP